MDQEASNFQTLIARVRDGDAEAARELVESYEAELRIVARSRLRDSKMRRALDSMDICQSVLGNFFVRAASGQFDVETPEELLKLLGTMARNKVTDHARREKADKRDAGRLAQTPADELPINAGTDSPSQVVAYRELLQRANAELPEDIRRISDLRRNGVGWAEIGSEMNESPEALRKRFTRCMDRVCLDLGLESNEIS